MKISKTLSNIIAGVIIAVSTTFIGGVGTFIYTTLETIKENKEQSKEIGVSLNTLNTNFILFTGLHKEQNIANNKRMDKLQDSLYCYRIGNANEHVQLTKTLDKIIIISRATNKDFNNLFNIATK